MSVWILVSAVLLTLLIDVPVVLVHEVGHARVSEELSPRDRTVLIRLGCGPIVWICPDWLPRRVRLYRTLIVLAAVPLGGYTAHEPIEMVQSSHRRLYEEGLCARADWLAVAL